MVKRIVVAVLALGVIAMLAVGYAFLKPTAEASKPIEAIPLAAGSTAAPTTAAPTSQATAAPTTQSPAQSGPSNAPGGPVVFELVQEESEARFVIDEVLNGSPKTVIGATNQVAGQIAVDAANPASTQVGAIQVNARTLSTDSEMRNRAIKNRILLTDQHEYVSFAPTELVGVPAAGQVGQSYSFQIKGDLTVGGVTRPVTFAVEVTPTSADRLEGLATATIRYADFNLTIPKVQSVASVEDEVRLELQFVAAPQS